MDDLFDLAVDDGPAPAPPERPRFARGAVAVRVRGDDRAAALRLTLAGYAVQAGAPDFVVDAGLGDRVVDVVDGLVLRRAGILDQLANGVWGPLSDAGARALLDAVAAQRLSGTLAVDD